LGSSSSQRKKSLQTLVFGEEATSKFYLPEPAFSAEATENPLHVAKALQSMPQVRSLKTLCLRGLKLEGGVFLMCMSPTLKKLHLTNLDLSQNDLGTASLVSLFEDMDVAGLKDLRLQDVKLRSGAAEEGTLWHIVLKKMRLDTLDVSRNELSDGSVALLGKNLSENATLSTLLADENCVSWSGQHLLFQALLWNASLRYVELSCLLRRS
jgi:Ran GTPase-activating protein (RanGAP) involved in mRNA processing and transport